MFAWQQLGVFHTPSTRMRFRFENATFFRFQKEWRPRTVSTRTHEYAVSFGKR